MDAANLIIDALAAGGATIGKGLGSELAKDAYRKLKEAVLHVIGHEKLDPDQDLSSSDAQADLADALRTKGEGRTKEMLALSAELVARLSAMRAEQLTPLGVDLDNVKALNIRIGQVIGGAVKIRGAEAAGDLDIALVRLTPDPK